MRIRWLLGRAPAGQVALRLVLALSPMVLSTSRASAADCLVRFDGAEAATDPWEIAIRDLERDLRDAPNDCASIDIHSGPDGATIELRTRDGRQALRRVERPDELAPLVKALLVGLPELPEEASRQTPDATTSSPALQPDSERGSMVEAAQAPDMLTAAPRARGPKPFGALGAGLELQPAEVGGAVGQILGGVTLGPWELGGFGRWELEHAEAEAHEAPRTVIGAVGGGALAGRRHALGPVLLAFGGTLGIYDVEEERGRRRRSAPFERVEQSFVDPRAGLYIALVAPASSRVRTRVQLGGEIAILEHASTTSVLPEVPRWGMGLTIGIELGNSL